MFLRQLWHENWDFFRLESQKQLFSAKLNFFLSIQFFVVYAPSTQYQTGGVSQGSILGFICHAASTQLSTLIHFSALQATTKRQFLGFHEAPGPQTLPARHTLAQFTSRFSLPLPFLGTHDSLLISRPKQSDFFHFPATRIFTFLSRQFFN